MKLTQSQLKEHLHYSPETGAFTRLVSTRLDKIGAVVGRTATNGYVIVSLLGWSHSAHRLAFLYMEGYFPEGLVDHKDRVKTNNKWDNLREASNSCNARNSNLSSTNTSGVLGVCWISERKKWSAHIKAEGKPQYLGRFTNKDNAVLARYKAEVKYKFYTCMTTSSAYLYLKERNII